MNRLRKFILSHKHTLSSLLMLVLLSLPIKAQNNPYVDDKLIHFGFSLGVDFLSYNVTEADAETQIKRHQKNCKLEDINNCSYDTIYHLRASNPGWGIAVGFITDLRLTRHLNLRFCPTLHFDDVTLNYLGLSEQNKQDSIRTRANIKSLPLSIPLYLKWSAEREINYRPYVIAGGGISYNMMRDKEKVILPKPFDYFLEVGFGCDFYFRWFKLCPELRYRIGFNNVVTPTSECEKEDWKVPNGDYYYTDAIQKLTNQQISLIFNFE